MAEAVEVTTARRTSARYGLALLLVTGVGVLAPLTPATAAVTTTPADANAPDQAALGDTFSTPYSVPSHDVQGLRLLDGPDVGTPTASVDAAAGTATVTIPGARRTSTLTLPWPLVPGTVTLSATATPAQRVTAVRDRSSCTFTDGSLVVRAAAQRPDGGVAVLDAQVAGSCALGSSYGEHLRGLVHIGTGTPLPGVPVAQPAELSGGALTGEVVEHPVVVSNHGGAPWTVRAVVTGADTGSHPESAVAQDTCTGTTLQPGADCRVTVRATARDYWTFEHLVVMGDGAADLVVPIRLHGHDPVPPPTAATLAAGRLSSRLTWQPPSPAPTYGYRVYDVTAGRVLVATAPSTATDVLVPGAGARTLALVAYAGGYAESEDVAVQQPRVATEVVAGQWYGSAPSAFPDGAPGRSLRLPPGPLQLSPDGREVLVAYPARICRLADEVCTAVPGLPSDAVEVQWLPDGRLAALVGQDAARALWVLGRDGGGARRVAALPSVDGLATTPDGLSVLVRDITTSGDSLVRIRLADGARTVVPGTAWIDGFSVSRTGRVVLERRVDLSGEAGPRRTTVMGLDGSAPHDLALPAGDNRQVAYDPSGTHLVWARHTDQFAATLWTAAADGSGATQLSDQVGDWHRPQWYVEDTTAPTAGLTGPSWSGATATWTVAAGDPDDAVGSLRRECRLDAGAWSPCGPTWTISGLGAGVHTASVRATDPAGRTGATASRTWSVDTTAPSTPALTVPDTTTTASVALRWTASDTGGSGLRSYDVRQRSASSTGGFGSVTQPARLQGLVAPSATVTVSPGYAYCSSVRARDAAGNTGAWSSERCTAVAMDDRSLSASGAWSRASSSSAAYSTTSVAASSGARLNRTTVQARRVGVVVTTCSGCGRLDVYLAGTRLGTVSTDASTTAYRQVRWLPLLSSPRTGALELRTTSSRRVIVDGVLLQH